MVDSLVPEVLPAPRSPASPKKTTENGSHFGEGPCLSADRDTLSNLADLSTLWY